MANDEPRSEPEFAFEDEFDYLFANTSPNPNREGCPSREELGALSRREKPIGDPGYLHIVRCSPCFREFRTMQQEHKRLRRAVLTRTLAVAATVAVAVAGYWLLPRDRGGREQTAASTTASTAAVAQQARLDLRPLAVTRGDTSRADPAPLALPRARLDATLLLPVGADEGAYELRLLDADLTARVTASGTAAIENFVTTLRATLDLQSLSPGMYQLGIRRAGGEWQMFPAQVE